MRSLTSIQLATASRTSTLRVDFDSEHELVTTGRAAFGDDSLDVGAGAVIGQQGNLSPTRVTEKRSKTFLDGNALRVCAGCEARFTPSRRNQRHCRPSCRARAFAKRRDAQPPLSPADWRLFE